VRRFDLSGGHPVLDLVNTLDNRFSLAGPQELLGDYGDLLRFMEESRLLSGPQAQALSATGAAAQGRVLRAVRALREAAAAVLYALANERPIPATQLQELAAGAQVAARHRELCLRSPSAAAPFAQLQWQWADLQQVEAPLWILADAAISLAISPEMRRLRACEADTCRWLFLDTSKNHSRRWCNMKICGNRMKARRFQARHGA
jgi:predicted RNA-binding Zn ribbon-like protein